MPIALYRLRKLNVAVHRSLKPVVQNFSPLQMRDLRLSRNLDGSETVQVFFTRIERRQELVIHHDEEWEFNKGVFRVIRRQLRNGRLIHERSEWVPPLFSYAWSQQPMQDWIWRKFEGEQTARCIIEQYLYQHVPNPDDYRIVTFDMNPKVAVNQRPIYMTHTLRPVAEVETAANTDRSEDADEWIKLFMGEK